MIVLADADLERAANAAAFYSMNNGGQVCISVERVYVEEPVYDEFVAKVTAKVRAHAPGQPGRARAPSTSARSSSRRRSTSSRSTSRTPSRRARRVLPAASAAAGPGALLRADRAGRRRPLDEVHDRGDLRADAADHEGARRRGGAASSPTTRRTGCRRRCGRRTSHRGERSRAAIEAGAVCVNDALLNYTRSSCRWAAGRRPASARATAPAGSASTRSSRRCSSRASRGKRDMHMFPYKARKTRLLGRLSEAAVRARQAGLASGARRRGCPSPRQ